MKNKKGFTLIELLAVIVVLAVIMVIAVPKILDVIESSRNSAADSSLKLVRSAIKTQVTTESMSSTSFTKEDGCYLFDFTNNNSNAQKLSLKNKDKVSGSIKYCDGKLKDDTLTWDGQAGNNSSQKAAQLTNDLNSNGQADIGDTITIGGENFYVIKNDGSTISIFAYHNLNAGKTFDSSNSTYTLYENPTYKQDETMKGFDINNFNIIYGVVVFAEISGWEYANNDTIPTSYYHSDLKTALEKYSKIISDSMGKTMTARLIIKSEIENLVNDGEALSSENIKDKADAKGFSWIYSSSYWTGSAKNSAANVVWTVFTTGLFSSCSDSDGSLNGVRPVFDISVNDI